MRTRQLVVAAVVILTFVLVQICFVNEIHLPWGYPDLPVLAVVALALAWGPIWGSCVGFVTGLMLDIAPPADHAVGRLAFAYALVGYLAGLLEDAEETSVSTTILVVAGASALLVLVDVGLAAVLGDGSVTAAQTGRLLASTVGYDVILAPFVVPLLAGLARRSEPVGAR
ncbi:MAG TPA: rod shape-determining protein MreD [Acidimicrobiales bacterium]|nr:rod shape-determining protein MreD [Acidimicrobiales bacterium]